MTRYCPQGDGAFDDWVAACPECGSTLDDAPPDPDEIETVSADVKPVMLTTAPNEIEANLIAGILRDEGIPVMVRPGGPGFGAWASVATFEHAIYVRDGDHARARRVLEETTIDEAEVTAPEEG